MPPFPSGNYVDPAYRQEYQTQQRGFRDLRQDVRRDTRFLRQDTKTQIKDLRTQRKRGEQDIGFERKDVRLGAARQTEDFETSLRNLVTDYQQLGRQQVQSGYAAGLGGGGYAAAAAERRASNLAREREPIDTGLARTQEDLDIAMRRLGVQERRLGQDVRHDTGLARREERRGVSEGRIETRRGRRELTLARPNLAAQARFQSQLLRRSLNPYTNQG